jgi:hypothetical protein
MSKVQHGRESLILQIDVLQVSLDCACMRILIIFEKVKRIPQKLFFAGKCTIESVF